MIQFQTRYLQIIDHKKLNIKNQTLDYMRDIDHCKKTNKHRNGIA